ncbi:MAG: glycosyltransferase family 9 protein [Bacteroidetes bacterium]|nr:glycosyltransferase family 9 protein [Bacteroidota bacterium]
MIFSIFDKFYICAVINSFYTLLVIHSDCLHFRGDIPCKPHKKYGVHCDGCIYYQPIDKRILIIKLGAIGDVIRTTPLVRRYRQLYPNCKITWLTLSPDILPQTEINEILTFNANSVVYLQNASFDIAINLDKEKEACSLLKQIDAKEKFGFTLIDNVPAPINSLAQHKFETGIFDDVSLQNTQSYCEEIFNICGLEYAHEEYLLDNHADKGYDWSFIDKSKKVVGLNTGCGGRWTTRLLPIESFIQLAKELRIQGYEVIILGGEQENERNLEISNKSGTKYPGYFPLNQFISLIDQCDLVVTQVTMGMHLTLGLKKKIVLMNNIFNPHEFDLFDRGILIQPDKKCVCFYLGTCKLGESCMHDLPPEKIRQAVNKLLPLEK